MLKYLKTTVFVAAFSVFILSGAEGQIMNQKLREPAAVPLDFLDWIERDSDWLLEKLSKQGIKSGFELSNGLFEASTVEALRSINRIRSFAYLAAPGLRPPYFDLWVSESAGGKIRCVTQFPRSIAPDITAQDFDLESFPESQADPTILDYCRVRPQKGADYLKLDRDAFRERFFDTSGDLKLEFIKRNTEAAFIAQAIDLGFFVQQQDVTGRLRLGVE